MKSRVLPFPLESFFLRLLICISPHPKLFKGRWPWLRETGRRKCSSLLLKIFNRDSVIINVPCYCLPFNPILDILQDLFPFLKNVHMGFLHIFYALFYWSHFCNQWLFGKKLKSLVNLVISRVFNRIRSDHNRIFQYQESTVNHLFFCPF
jgi:hypothetical protein